MGEGVNRSGLSPPYRELRFDLTLGRAARVVWTEPGFRVLLNKWGIMAGRVDDGDVISCGSPTELADGESPRFLPPTPVVSDHDVQLLGRRHPRRSMVRRPRCRWLGVMLCPVLRWMTSLG